MIAAAFLLISCWLCHGLQNRAFGRPRIRVLDVASQQIPYKKAWNWQERLVDHHIGLQDQGLAVGAFAGTLLMLQHRSVYTLGTATTAESGPFAVADETGPLDYEVIHSDRAGQATYHGPGQLVCYPIFDLNYFEKDIHSYLRGVEEVVIHTLADHGIAGERVDGLTGVWVGNSKLAAIGIRIRRWVTMHGVALNVNPDLRYFNNIVPCGISDRAVSAMSHYRPAITVSDVKASMMAGFAKVFQCDLEVVDELPAMALLESLRPS